MSERADPPRDEKKGAGPDAESDADAAFRGVSEVLNAAVNVGVSVAKAFADATSPSRATTPPPESARPLEAFVHYGVATVTNIIGMVTSGVGRATASRPAGASPAATAPTGPPRPTVGRATTLRVPLSIQNTGDEPMTGLTAVCTRVVGPAGAARTMPTAAVRFLPDVLSIAPRDFEKLTVFVDVPADAPIGQHEAVIILGDETFETRLAFDVVAGA
jgi:hypothetical protein